MKSEFRETAIFYIRSIAIFIAENSHFIVVNTNAMRLSQIARFTKDLALSIRSYDSEYAQLSASTIALRVARFATLLGAFSKPDRTD